jgi:Tol biopolymer transport system component
LNSIASKRRRFAIAGLWIVGLIVSGAPPASAYQRPGRTVSVTLGAAGDVGSYPTLSHDGRYVAFYSSASNIVTGDANESWDVFVRDRESGIVERISLGDGEEEGNSASVWPSISGDGRYVAFQSLASNLVPGDTNQTWDIFVRDRIGGTTERVSVDGAGAEVFGMSLSPSISADGRYVAFHSGAPDLVPSDPIEGSYDVFVRDRISGTIERVSEGAEGVPPNSDSYHPSISGDGRYVAFYSFASNLVLASDTNGVMTSDVYVRDRLSGTTMRVSVASDGTQGNRESLWPSISADGLHIAYYSDASNLVPWDTNGFYDVFVHDLVTSTTERVSVGDDGAEGEKVSSWSSISGDGRYVAFDSRAEDFVAEDNNGAYDVFVRDRELGTTELVSVGSDGSQGETDSNFAFLSQDGRHVAFWGQSSNFVPGDTAGGFDDFVRDRGRPIGVGGLSVEPQTDQVSVSGWATFSGAVFSATGDPIGDGEVLTGQAGADLTGASLTYHPESGSILLRLPLASIPRFAGGAGYPAVIYGLRFDLGGAHYEVRALTTSASAPDASLPPFFGLYRCEPTCAHDTRLSGGLGTTGDEVLISVPLSAIDAEEGAALSAIKAFTAVGEAELGTVKTLDEAVLPNAGIPARSVSLGIGSLAIPIDQIALIVGTVLQGGDFHGLVDLSFEAVRNHLVRARACLGERCDVATFPTG